MNAVVKKSLQKYPGWDRPSEAVINKEELKWRGEIRGLPETGKTSVVIVLLAFFFVLNCRSADVE